MSKTRKILVGVLILILVIQTIQPMRNISEGLSENDISKTFAISDHVHGILKEKCYDCHSNNTRYPWYNYIQPVGWWLSAHIHEGNILISRSSRPTRQKRSLISLASFQMPLMKVGCHWILISGFMKMRRSLRQTAIRSMRG